MNINEIEIKRLVDQAVKDNDSRGRFNVQSIPKHTHNGIDSVPIYSPTHTYTGYVPADGIINNSSQTVLFPSGWRCSLIEQVPQPEVTYAIFHNLNTNLFTVNVTQVTGTPITFQSSVIPVVAAADRAFLVFWWDFALGEFVRANFHFQLVQPNNKVTPLTTYTLNQP